MDSKCENIIEVGEGPSVCAPPEKPAEHHASSVLEESAYGIKIWVQKPFDEALSLVKSELKQGKFDILSEIDVREMFQNELNIKFPHYIILGVCNAQLGHQALELDRDIGLLMPCNFVVYEQSGGTIVEAVDPIAQFSIAGGTDLQNLARLIKQRFQDVINRVAAG